MEDFMKTTNKLTVPDLISIGVFTALYFVLVTIATFGSAAIAPGFNNVILPAVCALISGCVYMLLAAKLQKFGGISVMGIVMGLFGPIIPMWFMKDAYVANLEARGKDAAYIADLFANINMTTFVIAVAATLVCALVGGWFGQKMVKKHFVKAGIE